MAAASLGGAVIVRPTKTREIKLTTQTNLRSPRRAEPAAPAENGGTSHLRYATSQAAPS
ncbi:MAG: hypothetical protein R3D67_00725 [Hyphomicrobiaceae bacterium]